VKRWLALFALMISAVCTASAEAQATPRAEDAGESEEPERENREPDMPRRAVPDYDGRPPPPPSSEEVAVSVPRALLSPLHLVTEYVLRRPLGWVLTTAEREHWDIIQLLPFSQMRPTWGIVPTVLLDFGFVPSVGLYLFVHDVVIPHNRFHVQAGFGGVDWLRATVTDRQMLSRTTSIDIALQAWSRPDQLFLGLGPNARSDFVARYGRRRLEATAGLLVRPWRASHLRLMVGVSSDALYDTTYLDAGPPAERTLSDAVARGWFPGVNGLPAGWPGYTAYRQRIEGSIDSRRREPATAGGLRAEAHLEHAFDLGQPLDRRWLLWGGGVGAYVDVDRGRTIGLWTMTSLATRLGSAEIPFTELPDFGLDMRMPGFRPGWIRGESATILVLDYRYPIGPMLAGFVSAAVGNAFGPMLEGFAPGLLRMGFGMGIRTLGDPDQTFMLIAGMGTETFDQGLGITTFRLLFGSLQGL
jgi:hypothetical protein